MRHFQRFMPTLTDSDILASIELFFSCCDIENMLWFRFIAHSSPSNRNSFFLCLPFVSISQWPWINGADAYFEHRFYEFWLCMFNVHVILTWTMKFTEIRFLTRNPQHMVASDTFEEQSHFIDVAFSSRTFCVCVCVFFCCLKDVW